MDNHHGGVILVDGYIYGAASKGKWVCIDWDSGKTMYTAPGVGKGSLTYADGMLYTLSENGKMGLVPATPERLEVVSQFAIPKGGEGPSWAYPVVCGGRLYIRHDDFLYAYNIREGIGGFAAGRKSEIRISKSETNPKFEYQMFQTAAFRSLEFSILNLFRISIFGFRA